MTSKDHFSEKAAEYAAARPTYPPELGAYLESIVPQQSLAWDAGCGSGQLSVLLADHFERVIATDASAEQIARGEPRPNLEYQCAPAEKSLLSAESADLATAAQAAHWFDLEAYYREVRRVVRPGGAIALITYGNMVVDQEIDPVVMRFYTRVLGPCWPPERRHVEDGYRSLAFPFEPIEVPALEIRVDWDLDATLAYIGTWSALNAFEKVNGTPEITAFQQEMGRVWGSGMRAVRWPVAMRVGRI